MNTFQNLINLSPEQKNIFELIEKSNNNFFITGKAGTGKSFLLKYFKEHTSKNVLYTAPTGIAAINIGGITIHSAFGFDNLKDGINFFKLNSLTSVLKNSDVLVIDEISMVRVDVLEQIDKILKYANYNQKPFGGKQVILFGDIFQLSPVATYTEKRYFKDKYGDIYFFNSNAYKNGNFMVKELRIIHRQTTKDFIDILNNIREGKLSNNQMELLNRHCINKFPSNIVQLVPTKALSKKINFDNLCKINMKEYNYQANISYNTNIKNIKTVNPNDYMCDFNLKLKVGATIMMVSNDNEYGRWVNGTFGIVSALGENYIKVIIENNEYNVERADFIKYRCYYNREKKKLTYIQESCVSQYPLILAYAITIHKSQGMTYQEVICNLDGCFASGQVYVALSRCANFEKLYLVHRIDLKVILVNNDILKFYNQKIKSS